MPVMPIYMINGISISIVIIASCLLFAKRYKNTKIIDILNKTGQLALTFYVVHVILGMGIMEEMGPLKLGENTIKILFVYALVLFVCYSLRFGFDIKSQDL